MNYKDRVEINLHKTKPESNPALYQTDSSVSYAFFFLFFFFKSGTGLNLNTRMFFLDGKSRKGIKRVGRGRGGGRGGKRRPQRKQEPINKFPYYYSAAMLTSSLIINLTDSLFCILNSNKTYVDINIWA